MREERQQILQGSPFGAAGRVTTDYIDQPSLVVTSERGKKVVNPGVQYSVG